MELKLPVLCTSGVDDNNVGYLPLFLALPEGMQFTAHVNTPADESDRWILDSNQTKAFELKPLFYRLCYI